MYFHVGKAGTIHVLAYIHNSDFGALSAAFILKVETLVNSVYMIMPFWTDSVLGFWVTSSSWTICFILRAVAFELSAPSRYPIVSSDHSLGDPIEPLVPLYSGYHGPAAGFLGLPFSALHGFSGLEPLFTGFPHQSLSKLLPCFADCVIY